MVTVGLVDQYQIVARGNTDWPSAVRVELTSRRTSGAAFHTATLARTDRPWGVAMLGATSLNEIMSRAHLAARNTGSHKRLVSVLFAPPKYLDINELLDNFASWDGHSGDGWDLFFAGYHFVQSSNGTRTAYYSSGELHKIAEQMATEARASRVNPVLTRPRWRYSGTADIVGSWSTAIKHGGTLLTGTKIADGMGRPFAKRSLSEIVATFTHWQEDGLPAEFRGRRRAIGRQDIAAGLQWVAGATSAGIIGNYAYDSLIEQLIR